MKVKRKDLCTCSERPGRRGLMPAAVALASIATFGLAAMGQSHSGMQTQPVKSQPGDTSLLTSELGGTSSQARAVPYEPPATAGGESVVTIVANGSSFDVDVTDTPSIAAFGNPSNVVLTVDVGANAHVTGIGYVVTLTAVDPSWLSELRLEFTDTAIAGGVGLTPGFNEGFPGQMSYSSGGVIDLVGLGLDFNVGADGLLRLEFWETFVDFPAPTPDGFWGSGGGGPDPDSDCCIANGTAGCDDATCEGIVCSIDSFCCDTEWDQICADIANEECDVCTGGEFCTTCCTASGGLGCEDPDCEALICSQDSFCCDVAWDQICADAASAQCDCCGGPPPGGDCPPGAAGSCCAANGSPGCNDDAGEGCCAAVCACDPFCCEVEWDAFCATTGFDADCLCGPGACGALNTPECDCTGLGPCDGAVGDCCISNGSPGCDQPDCCAAICAADAFCCDVTWDSLCAGAALTDPNCDCGPGGTPENDACEDAISVDVPSVTAGTTIGATLDNVGTCVTSNTAPGVWYAVTGTGNTMTASTCSLFGGSADYDTKISVFCGDCPAGGGPASDCCISNGTPGCDDPDCQALICAQDSFCCDVSWDGICAAAAEEQCAVCQSEGGLICITGNDDSCGAPGEGLRSTVNWCSQEGATYLILVHGFSAGIGNFELSVSDGAACGGAIECIPAEPTGGCCNCDGPNRVCSVLSEDDCLAAGGTYLGDGTDCSSGDEVVFTADVNASLPDNNPAGVSSTISVPKSFSVTDVNVELNITHTWVGDLCVTLSHGGTTVSLIDRPGADAGVPCHSGSPFGCSQDNYNGIVLDDQGTGGPIEALCVLNATSPPNYVPNELLAAFNGMDASGDWTLNVSDNAGGDLGTFVSWSISFAVDSAGDVCDGVVNCGDGDEACGIGFWKNHPELWQGFSPDQMFSSVFVDAFPGESLMDVLSAPAGPPSPGIPPQLRNLGRFAVSALVNAATVDFSMTVGEVVALFNDAYNAWQGGGGVQALVQAQTVLAARHGGSCPSFNTADLNQDTSVNVNDLMILLSEWGLEKNISDLNEDGNVDIGDLLILLSNWGDAPVE